MAKSSKLDIVWIALLAVAVVGLVLAIVGVCIDYVAYDVTLLNNTNTTSYSFGDLAEAQSNYKDLTGNSYYGTLGATEAMAIITIVLSALTAIFVAVSKFVNIKFANIIKLALGALTVVFAIIAIILASTFTDVLEVEYYAAAGAWLVLVGGILAGAAGVVAGLKK
ncbi:MAG: hypothetical protein LUD19_03915 [Clostridia bacterium]|nr:hypothetical protein [Clostridia bacterium]